MNKINESCYFWRKWEFEIRRIDYKAVLTAMDLLDKIAPLFQSHGTCFVIVVVTQQFNSHFVFCYQLKLSRGEEN
jgi:hypothetical protein